MIRRAVVRRRLSGPWGRPLRVRVPVLAVLLVLTASSLGAIAAPVAAEPKPSVQDIQRSKDEVAKRAQQVSDARSRIAATQAELDRLGQAAEVAVEKWHQAQVQLADAQRREEASRVAMAAAQARVDTAQRRMNGFVAAAYMSGGDMSKLDTLVSADAPSTFLRKMNSLDAVSRSQRDAVGALAGARAYQHVVVQEAQRVTATRKQAASAMDSARRAAQDKVDQQQTLMAQLQSEENHLEDLLAGAQAKVKRLERERKAALAREAALARQRELERQRRAAEAAAAAAAARNRSIAPVVVEGGDPGAVAVRWAEKELGVPYAWGGGDASGPTYGVGYGATTYGFDCSGLTLFAYAHAGIYLDHWTGSQWNSGRHVGRGEVRPGDLLFFATNTSDPSTIHHVGMYVGGGRMIEAPYTGSEVRISSAWRSDFIGAVRPYAG